MENVSNSAFTDVRRHCLLVLTPADLWPSQHEFGRLARQLEFEKLHLPTTSAAAKVKANLDKHKDFILTEVCTCHPDSSQLLAHTLLTLTGRRRRRSRQEGRSRQPRRG